MYFKTPRGSLESLNIHSNTYGPFIHNDCFVANAHTLELPLQWGTLAIQRAAVSSEEAEWLTKITIKTELPLHQPAAIQQPQGNHNQYQAMVIVIKFSTLHYDGCCTKHSSYCTPCNVTSLCMAHTGCCPYSNSHK